MKSIKAAPERSEFYSKPESFVGRDVDFSGMVLRSKDMGKFKFVHVKSGPLLVQVVTSSSESFPSGTSVRVKGKAKETNLKDSLMNPRTLEIQENEIEILGRPTGILHLILEKKSSILEMTSSLIIMVSLRHPKGRHLSIQSKGIAGFREAFKEQAAKRFVHQKL